MPQRLTRTRKGLRSSPLLLSNGGEHSPLCSLQRLGNQKRALPRRCWLTFSGSPELGQSEGAFGRNAPIFLPGTQSHHISDAFHTHACTSGKPTQTVRTPQAAGRPPGRWGTVTEACCKGASLSLPLEPPLPATHLLGSAQHVAFWARYPHFQHPGLLLE